MHSGSPPGRSRPLQGQREGFDSPALHRRGRCRYGAAPGFHPGTERVRVPPSALSSRSSGNDVGCNPTKARSTRARDSLLSTPNGSAAGVLSRAQGFESSRERPTAKLNWRSARLRTGRMWVRLPPWSLDVPEAQQEERRSPKPEDAGSTPARDAVRCRRGRQLGLIILDSRVRLSGPLSLRRWSWRPTPLIRAQSRFDSGRRDRLRVAQSGRAPGSGPGGRGIEALHVDRARAAGRSCLSHGRCGGFESLTVHRLGWWNSRHAALRALCSMRACGCNSRSEHTARWWNSRHAGFRSRCL